MYDTFLITITLEMVRTFIIHVTLTYVMKYVTYILYANVTINVNDIFRYVNNILYNISVYMANCYVSNIFNVNVVNNVRCILVASQVGVLLVLRLFLCRSANVV